MGITYKDLEAGISKAMDKGYEIGFKEGYLACLRHIKKQCEIKLKEVESLDQKTIFESTFDDLVSKEDN